MTHKKFFILFTISCGSMLLWCKTAWAVPPAPSGLTAVAPYNGDVNLWWATPDASATVYQVSRFLQDTPTSTPTGTVTPAYTPTPIATVLSSAVTAGAGTPVFQDFSVTNGRSYLYQVVGIDGLGATGVPASLLAAPFAPPSAVQPVTVQNIHSNALDLFWGIPASSYPVSYYQVYRYVYLTATPTPNPPYTATLTPTGTWNTPTITPTPTFPTTLVPAPTVLTPATPVATVLGATFIDTSPNSSGAAAFYYVVMAVDNQGHLSAQPTYATNPALPIKMAPPGPPVLSGLVSLSATPVIGTMGYGARLFWTGSLSTEGVTVYQVLQNSTPIATIAYPGPTATMTYDDKTIPANNGSPTNYNVVAVSTFGTGNSNTASVTLVQVAEGPIQVTPNATANAVTVTWNPGTGGTFGLGGYRVYKSLNGPPAANPTPILPGNPTATPTPTPFAVVTFTPSTTFTITPVVDTTIINHMSYWVEPVDVTGHGGLVGSASTPALNLAPTPPSAVGVLNPVGNNQIGVTWAPGNAGFFGQPVVYVLYRTVLPNLTPTPTGTLTPVPTATPTNTGTLVPTFTPTPVATIAFGQSAFTDIVSGYSAGSTIGYQLGLIDTKGNVSDWAASGNLVTTVPLTLPATPATIPFTGSAASIQFGWLRNPAADGVTAYYVFAGQPTMTVTPLPVLVVNAPSSIMTFAPTPTPWAANYYYVVARNPSGYSQPAALAGIPVPTYQVTAVMTPGSRQVQVSWTMVPTPISTPAVDSYGIYRALTPGVNFTPLATVALGASTYSDAVPVATAGVTYYYRVTARAGGASGHLAESPLYPVMTPNPEAGLLNWPNVPGGWTARSGVTQTTLSWVGNPPQENVSSYSIFLNGSPTPFATLLATQSPTPTFVFAATETPGALSSYQVVANNPKGPSDLSQTVSVLVPPAVTPTIALTPPPNFTPAATLTPGVWISSLTYSNAVSGYSIYRQSPPTPGTTPTFVPVGAVGLATPFITDPGVPGYVNNYQVVANNGAGLASIPAISAQLAVTLWPAPPNPSLFPSSTAITISWATPIGNVPVTLYDIYRNAYPTTTPVLLAKSTPPVTSYTDSAVTTGSAYIYWMDAQNASGASSLSVPQTIIPIQAPTLYLTPLPARNLLYWSPIAVPTTSPVTGYAVFRAIPTPNATPTFVQIGSIVEPLSNTAYVDSQVSDTASYVYEIAPSSQGGILGPFSNQAAVTVLPQPVTNLVAVSGDGLVQLRWNYGGVASNTYVIQRRLGTAPDVPASYTTLKTGFQGVNFMDTGVTDKNFYVYRIYTVDAGGLTSNGFVSAVALPAAPPIIYHTGSVDKRNLTITQDQNGNTLSWFPANSAVSLYDLLDPTKMYPLGGYSVYKSTDGGGVYQAQPNIVPAASSGGGYPNQVTFVDGVQLINGSTFTYLVQAFDLPPDLPSSLNQAVTQGLVHMASYNTATAYSLGAGAALDRNAIRPFGAGNEQIVHIRIAVTNPGNVNIKVYTLNGTFVKELVNAFFNQGVYGLPGSSYPISWDAHNMNGTLVASGVYLISVEMAGHQEFQKVAVIK